MKGTNMTQIKDENVVLYTDGAARGNPGPAAIGVVICMSNEAQTVMYQEGKKINDTTNNQAEYRALIRGLEICKDLLCHVNSVEHFTDSQLVYFQLIGKWKVRKASLRGLKDRVDDLKECFDRVTFHWVRREHPKIQLADCAANQALDERG